MAINLDLVTARYSNTQRLNTSSPDAKLQAINNDKLKANIAEKRAAKAARNTDTFETIDESTTVPPEGAKGGMRLVSKNANRADGKKLEVNLLLDKGTVGADIMAHLEGKVANASQIAYNLEHNIFGTYRNKNATLEERAVNRETALQNAQYIADNYFKNAEEAKGFMDEITKQIDNDELREKGYSVMNDGSKPLKPYELLFHAVDEFALNSYVKYYENGKYDSLKDIENKGDFMRFMDANYKTLNPKIIAEFSATEKAVSAILDAVKKDVADGKYNSAIQENLEKIREFL